MNAQSADTAILCRQRGVYTCLHSGIERFATVDDRELQAHVVRAGFYRHITLCLWRVGVVHHIDHCLFNGDLYLHGFFVIQANGLAHLTHEVVQLGHLARIIGQDEAPTHFNVALLTDVLDTHHREVVALLGIAHKGVNGIGHPLDDLPGLVLLAGQCLEGRFFHTLHLELILVCIHSLGQTVGEEEDGSASEDLHLLQREFPLRTDTHGNVGIAGQRAEARTYEQRGVVAGIGVIEAPRRQVEHTNEKGDKHEGLVHIDYRLVHRGHDAIGHRLMRRYGAED